MQSFALIAFVADKVATTEDQVILANPDMKAFWHGATHRNTGRRLKAFILENRLSSRQRIRLPRSRGTGNTSSKRDNGISKRRFPVAFSSVADILKIV
jgi:hypothetical protein